MKKSIGIDPLYLAKMKQAGFSDLEIAERCGIGVSDVTRSLDEMKHVSESFAANGLEELRLCYTNLCLQFQEMGKGLSRVGFALGNIMERGELEALLEQSKSQPDPVAFIRARCIILRPYVPQELEKEIEAYVSGYLKEAAAASD